MSPRLFPLGGLLVRAVVALPPAYLGLLTVASRRELRRRVATRSVRDTSDPVHRFAILVPAHDEEQLIASTVHSLAALDYPVEQFSVHVVADNCTDRTVELARAAGADVHERSDLDDPGKGPALQWLMARLWSRGDDPDAVMFLDADTTIDPGFLRAVDRHLRSGADVVQGHYSVRGVDEAATVAFRAAALAARTFLRPLGRVAIGGSAGLHGNGMVFRRGVMERHQWSNHLTEDVELSLDLLLDGVKVAFADDARIAAEMPTTLAASRTQHERWERGRLQTARAYVPAMARRSVTGGPAGRVAYADALLDQLVPPFSIVVASTSLWTAVATIGVLLKPQSRRRRRSAAAAAAAMATQAWFVYSALRMTNAPRSVYRSLLGAPRQVAWKVGLWLRVVRRPDDVSWTRTARNEN
jgi:cellulose synthase/poly-beta-1,6-N-acetylglucosamine synthase-like glycosyltransferase